MTIIEKAPLPNGAHANRTAENPAIPEGWAEIPAEFLPVWETFKPFVDIETDDSGKITAMTPGARPEVEAEPEIITGAQVSEALSTLTLAALGLEAPVKERAEAEVVLLKSRGVPPAGNDNAEWTAGEYVTAGAVRTVSDVAYECIIAHLTGGHWHPSVTTGHVWRVVRSEDGTPENPIPFVPLMAVRQGLCYVHEGRVYRWLDADIASCPWSPGTAGMWQWEEIN